MFRIIFGGRASGQPATAGMVAGLLLIFVLPAAAKADCHTLYMQKDQVNSEISRLVPMVDALRKGSERRCQLLNQVVNTIYKFDPIFSSIPSACGPAANSGLTTMRNARNNMYRKTRSFISEECNRSSYSQLKPVPVSRPVASSNKVASNPTSCSDVTGLPGDTAAPKRNCAQPTIPRPLVRQSGPQNAVKPAAPNPTPPSNGAAAVESLRTMLPELGGLIDDANREVNSPNTPPPSQWQAPSRAGEASRRSSRPDSAERSADNSLSARASANDESKSPNLTTDDDDYAEICRSESVKNGLKSLKQDFEEARKNEDSRFGLRYFIKKIKLNWATLKRCVRDPLQKAVIEKLEHDQIIQQ